MSSEYRGEGPSLDDAPRPQARLHVHIALKAFNIIDDAVMRGVEYGVTRSFKHTDKPSREHIIEQVQRAVIGELCEVLDFDGPKERVG